jgi:hypothetical protein
MSLGSSLKEDSAGLFAIKDNISKWLLNGSEYSFAYEVGLVSLTLFLVFSILLLLKSYEVIGRFKAIVILGVLR